ncbi:salt tolerance down-regulator-domain-containing protein [Gloeopeniophorella convolvens]|nr:salt tolerance down-regulator-domain-containing protein [Gloeopeniophorella convolvens]
MAAGKQKMAAAAPPAHETQSRKTRKKRQRAANANSTAAAVAVIAPGPEPDTPVDDIAPLLSALPNGDALDLGVMPTPDDGLAEAIAAVLEAPRAAAAAAAAGADATAAAQAELLATANELYQRMDAGGGGLRPDGAYWAALPAHIRNFAQAMYTIAQQMVHTGEQGEGAVEGPEAERDGEDGDGMAGGLVAGWQGEMTLPVHPSFFSDAAFSAALEHEAQQRQLQLLQQQQQQQQQPPLDPEEPPELIEPASPESAGDAEETVAGVGREVLTDPEAGADLDEAKRPKAANAHAHAHALKHPSAALSAPPQASTPPPPMPAQTRQPSSRAQGKQPMNYPPPPAAATPAAAQKTGTPSPTTRSSRAASKQPLQPHAYPHPHPHHHPSPPSSNASQPQKHRPPASQPPASRANNSSHNANNKIWSTSSTEERERIKEFWLGLGEEERRNLVKVEKEAVLKKMKEQQRHSCACAVCGRKRSAIEDELEVLYDAYYDELEQYANIQQRYVASGGAHPPPPGPGPFPGSVELDKNGTVIGAPAPRARPPSSPRPTRPHSTAARTPPRLPSSNTRPSRRANLTTRSPTRTSTRRTRNTRRKTTRRMRRMKMTIPTRMTPTTPRPPLSPGPPRAHATGAAHRTARPRTAAVVALRRAPTGCSTLATTSR